MLRILYCDDEPAQEIYLQRAVQKWEEISRETIRLQTFRSAEEVLFELDQTVPYDLLLLDIQMKQMNGMELAREIRKRDRNVAVAFLTNDPGLDYRIGQDVRIYQMADMLLQRTKENIRKLDPLEWGRVMGKTGVKNLSLGTLLSFLSYAYVAVCARAGIFPVGNVLLYASSVERFTDAVQQFLSEYSQYCYRFAYLKSYADFLGSSDMLYDGTLPVEKRDDGEYEFELKDVSFS